MKLPLKSIAAAAFALTASNAAHAIHCQESRVTSCFGIGSGTKIFYHAPIVQKVSSNTTFTWTSHPKAKSLRENWALEELL